MGPQGQNLHPPGQAVGDPGQEHDVGGPGQEEPPGTAVPVHRGLDGQEQAGRPLDLVQERPLGELVQEPDRIGAGRAQGIEVIERPVAAAGNRRLERQGQGALAGLPGPGEEGHRGIGQGAQNLWDQHSRVHAENLSHDDRFSRARR